MCLVIFCRYLHIALVEAVVLDPTASSVKSIKRVGVKFLVSKVDHCLTVEAYLKGKLVLEVEVDELGKLPIDVHFLEVHDD